MRSKEDQGLRSHLAELLRGGSAHLDADSVFDGIKTEHWGSKMEGAPHSLWELLEHIRFTLHDLVDFCNNSHYVAPEWPKAYWPETDSPKDAAAIKHSLKEFQGANDAMQAIVADPQTDLFAKIPWGDGQTVLREALLAADHTSYHLGQAMFLRKQLESSTK